MQKVAVAGFIIIIILSLALIFTKKPAPGGQKNTPLPSPTATAVGQVMEFEGIMTKFDEQCAVDALCVAYVNGYSIIVNPGHVRTAPEMGTTDVWTQDVGHMVRVKALKTGVRELTILGSKDYYVLKK